MKSKLKIALICCLVLSIVLTGCGTPAAPATPAAPTAPATPTGEVDHTQGPTINVTLGHVFAVTHPMEYISQGIRRDMLERTGGRITVEVFPAGQMGGGREMMTALMNGTIDIATTATWGTIDNRILMAELPYMFADWDHINRFRHSDIGNELLDNLSVHGVYGFDWMVSGGFRNIGNTVREVHTPADLDGLLIRAFENEILLDILDALGADATVLPFPEVYAALQTGTIQGEDNAFLNTYHQRFFEVQQYKTETRHMINFEIKAISHNFWNSLSPEDQALFTEVMSYWCERYSQMLQDDEAAYMQRLIDEGMTITLIPDYTPWIEAVQPVYEKWAEEFGWDAINTIRGL